MMSDEIAGDGTATKKQPGVTGSRATLTPPKRRSFLSREMCGDIAAILTILIVTGAAFAATPLADLGVVPDGLNERTNRLFLVATGAVSGLILSEALRLGGYYSFDHLLNGWGAIRGVAWRWALVLLALIAVGFGFGMTEQLSRPWLAGWGVLTMGGLVLGRFGMAAVLKKLTADGRSLSRKIAVVGDPEIAEAFVARARERESGIQIAGHFSVEEMAVSGKGAMARAQKLVEDGLLDDVVLCLPNAEHHQMSALISRLSALPVHIALCPDAFWLERGIGQVTTIGSMPLMTVHRRPISGWAEFVKMMEDKVLGGILFLMALPIMALCALAVRLDSKGPIFFIQHRQGFAGEIFPILKFRTMRVMENDGEVKQATKDDDRITKVGRILRRYSLDELPQLWNVLRGDMSLVGPRPHALAHDKYYVNVIDDYASRHKVKPGITGWAQVNGFRGETADDETMAARVRYDLAYIERWSLWFDLRIIIMTAVAVLLPKNAY